MRRRPSSRLPARERRRLVAGAALAVFVVGLGVAIARGLHGGSSETTPLPTALSPKPTPAPAPTPARLVELTAVGAFDPEGDGRERDEEASLAVDGRRDTAWRTERYSHFFKSGVGLVLDAGRRVRVEQVVVDSPSPGVRAEIRLGDAREGPFAKASPAQTLADTTRFVVARRPARYVVVWVVGLPPESAGEISEVRVRAR
jgi:hypothetical protein